MKKVKIAFDIKPLSISPEHLLVTKTLPPHITTLKKYKQIRASIGEIGIIEPLCITGQKAPFILLDGHLRLMILKELGYTEIPCLISNDDENYTHNKHVNRLAPVQEHLMISKAIEQGVDKEKLAKALNLDPQSIKIRLNLLNGICPKVAELLKDANLSPQIFSILKKMKHIRQLECTKLLIASNNFTINYMKALLMRTNENLLITPRKKTQMNHLILENEIANLYLEYQDTKQTLAEESLKLVIATNYLNRIISNQMIYKYLKKYHTDILSDLEMLIKMHAITDG